MTHNIYTTEKIVGLAWLHDFFFLCNLDDYGDLDDIFVKNLDGVVIFCTQFRCVKEYRNRFSRSRLGEPSRN